MYAVGIIASALSGLRLFAKEGVKRLTKMFNQIQFFTTRHGLTDVTISRNINLVAQLWNQNWFHRLSPVDKCAVQVMVAILNEDSNFRASAGMLASVIGTTRQTIYRSFRTLEGLKVIRKERPAVLYGGDRLPVEYSFDLGRITEIKITVPTRVQQALDRIPIPVPDGNLWADPPTPQQISFYESRPLVYLPTLDLLSQQASPALNRLGECRPLPARLFGLAITMVLGHPWSQLLVASRLLNFRETEAKIFASVFSLNGQNAIPPLAHPVGKLANRFGDLFTKLRASKFLSSNKTPSLELEFYDELEKYPEQLKGEGLFVPAPTWLNQHSTPFVSPEIFHIWQKILYVTFGMEEDCFTACMGNQTSQNHLDEDLNLHFGTARSNGND